MTTIQRLAVVNRGEPAMRCISAVAELNQESGEPITTIALYTEPDAASWFVREANEAVLLGPATFVDADGHRKSSYLDLDRLMAALAQARADAVWVGWGFVAESAEFAKRCEEAGINFIGPTSDVIALLGDKVRAKQLAESVGVPVVPWSGGPVHDPDSAVLAADLQGYPVLVKAASGGGGRGIRLVESADQMREAFGSAQAEAEHAFGDRTVFIERKLDAARHVEVQVVADGQGAVWAVGVRDCSIQRRNQKVIGESASTLLDEAGQQALCDAAVRMCAAAGYRSIGSVAFLVDPVARDFMFLEVNTRLQAEHPVTELATGLDLVKLQLAIAEGGRLITGGERVGNEGYFIQPTVIADVDPMATISQQEIFGPVLAVLKSRSFEHGLQIANNTEFGLTGAVYTNSDDKIEAAKQQFHVGNLYINRKCSGAMVGAHPFGGFNMSGTDSKAGGPDYLLLFTQAKSIGEKITK